MIKYVILSVYHTGTTSLIEHFEQLVDQKIGAWPLLGAHEPIDLNKSLLVHTHLAPAPPFNPVQRLYCYMLANTFPTYFPVRDPLQTLISDFARKNIRSKGVIIDQYKLMVDIHRTRRSENTMSFWPTNDLLLHENKGPAHPLRDAYQQEDLRYISDNLPTWHDLVNERPLLRPFMEEQGFEDLLWY